MKALILKLKKKLRTSRWWNSKLARTFIPRSNFAKNVLTLSSGTLLAISITFITTPIFSRMFTPGDYGILSVFTSLVALITALATLRFETAIVLPKKDKEAVDLIFVSFVFLSIISLFSLVILTLFNKFISGIVFTPSIARWLYLVPLQVFILVG